MTYPELCPICSCPIQLLCDPTGNHPIGTIDDAMAEHRRVVHKDEPEVTA